MQETTMTPGTVATMADTGRAATTAGMANSSRNMATSNHMASMATATSSHTANIATVHHHHSLRAIPFSLLAGYGSGMRAHSGTTMSRRPPAVRNGSPQHHRQVSVTETTATRKGCTATAMGMAAMETLTAATITAHRTGTRTHMAAATAMEGNAVDIKTLTEAATAAATEA